MMPPSRAVGMVAHAAHAVVWALVALRGCCAARRGAVSSSLGRRDADAPF